MGINYNGREFHPIANSAIGQVNGDTSFLYKQQGDLLTATYQGGLIRFGQIVGLVREDDSLDLCYQHLTEAGELRSGRCHSTPERLPDGRLRLHERWQWSDGGEGESTIEE